MADMEEGEDDDDLPPTIKDDHDWIGNTVPIRTWTIRTVKEEEQYFGKPRSITSGSYGSIIPKFDAHQTHVIKYFLHEWHSGTTLSEGQNILKELSILSRLSHPNLIALQDIQFVTLPRLYKCLGIFTTMERARGDLHHLWMYPIGLNKLWTQFYDIDILSNAKLLEMGYPTSLIHLHTPRKISQQQPQPPSKNEEIKEWMVPLIPIIFFQMLQAVQFLHKSGITHLDLKPGNFLWFDNFHALSSSEQPSSPAVQFPMIIKLCDMGLCKYGLEEEEKAANITIAAKDKNFDLRKSLDSIVQTCTYRCPEIANSLIWTCATSYSTLADNFSLGLILLDLLYFEGCTATDLTGAFDRFDHLQRRYKDNIKKNPENVIDTSAPDQEDVLSQYTHEILIQCLLSPQLGQELLLNLKHAHQPLNLTSKLMPTVIQWHKLPHLKWRQSYYKTPQIQPQWIDQEWNLILHGLLAWKACDRWTTSKVLQSTKFSSYHTFYQQPPTHVLTEEEQKNESRLSSPLSPISPASPSSSLLTLLSLPPPSSIPKDWQMELIKIREFILNQLLYLGAINDHPNDDLHVVSLALQIYDLIMVQDKIIFRIVEVWRIQGQSQKLHGIGGTTRLRADSISWLTLLLFSHALRWIACCFIKDNDVFKFKTTTLRKIISLDFLNKHPLLKGTLPTSKSVLADQMWDSINLILQCGGLFQFDFQQTISRKVEQYMQDKLMVDYPFLDTLMGVYLLTIPLSPEIAQKDSELLLLTTSSSPVLLPTFFYLVNLCCCSQPSTSLNKLQSHPEMIRLIQCLIKTIQSHQTKEKTQFLHGCSFLLHRKEHVERLQKTFHHLI